MLRFILKLLAHVLLINAGRSAWKKFRSWREKKKELPGVRPSLTAEERERFREKIGVHPRFKEPQALPAVTKTSPASEDLVHLSGFPPESELNGEKSNSGFDLNNPKIETPALPGEFDLDIPARNESVLGIVEAPESLVLEGEVVSSETMEEKAAVPPIPPAVPEAAAAARVKRIILPDDFDDVPNLPPGKAPAVDVTAEPKEPAATPPIPEAASTESKKPKPAEKPVDLLRRKAAEAAAAKAAAPKDSGAGTPPPIDPTDPPLNPGAAEMPDPVPSEGWSGRQMIQWFILLAIGLITAAVIYNQGLLGRMWASLASFPWGAIAIAALVLTLIAGIVFWISRNPAQAKAAAKSGWTWTREKTRGTGRRWLALLLLVTAAIVMDWGLGWLFGATGQIWFRFDFGMFLIGWAVIGLGIFVLNAFSKQKSSFRTRFRNEDYWLVIATVTLFVNFILALTIWGRPLALPREGLSPEMQAWWYNLKNGFLYGNAAAWKTAKDFTAVNPWAGATWVWSKVFWINLPLYLIFAIYALRDGFRLAMRKAEEEFRAGAGVPPPPPPGGAANTGTAPPREEEGFGLKHYLAWELFSKLLEPIFFDWLKRKWSRAR